MFHLQPFLKVTRDVTSYAVVVSTPQSYINVRNIGVYIIEQFLNFMLHFMMRLFKIYTWVTSLITSDVTPLVTQKCLQMEYCQPQNVYRCVAYVPGQNWWRDWNLWSHCTKNEKGWTWVTEIYEESIKIKIKKKQMKRKKRGIMHWKIGRIRKVRTCIGWKVEK